MSKILIVGLPFFPKKYQYAVDAYQELGCKVKVLLNKSKANECDMTISMVSFSSTNNMIRLKRFIIELIRFKPNNIDCYNYSMLSIFYILIARLFRVNTRFWIIGGELLGDSQNANSNSLFTRVYSKIKKCLTWGCVRFCNVVFAKEMHHVKSIRARMPKALSKTVQIHNCVPVPTYDYRSRKAASHDFLYANAVIASRNVISLINSFKDLQAERIKFKASIYGFNSISNEVYNPRGVPYSERALQHFRNLQISDAVDVHGFVVNIKQVMKEYRFFVFPSDVVLANYALLESMSMGLVPIVYPGDGYEKLVKDGVNGFVAFDRDLTAVFKRALSMSEPEYLDMSKAAYDSIAKDFSMHVWLQKLGSHLR